MELYYSGDSRGDYYKVNKELCEMVLDNCKNIYGEDTRLENIKSGNFTLTNLDCVAVLTEVDFIDNLKKNLYQMKKNKWK